MLPILKRGKTSAMRLSPMTIRKTGANDFQPLAILITDDSGSVIGGLWGRTV